MKNSTYFQKVLGVSAAGVLLAARPCSAAILVQDNFSASGILAGKLPDTEGNTPWGGNTGFSSNGNVITYANASAGMASIDLGAGYFTSNPGIYEISLTVTFAANETPGTGVWGLGFSNASSANSGTSLASGAAGRPWAFLRENGIATLRNNSSSVNLATTTVTAVGNSHTLKIRLDTTSSSSWTFAAFINGTQFGDTQSTAANSDLRYVAITATTILGSVDNFLLTGPIPEPSAPILGAVAALCLAGRRTVRST